MFELILTTVNYDWNGEVRIRNFSNLILGVIKRNFTIYETLSGNNILADCGFYDDRRTITFDFDDFDIFTQLKTLIATHSEFDIYTIDGVFRGALVLTQKTNGYSLEMQTYQKLTT